MLFRHSQLLSPNQVFLNYKRFSKEMPLYDIVQLDDDTNVRENIQAISEADQLRYFGIGSLIELERCLPKTEAKVWVVDGRFPREPGGQVLLLAEEAIKAIRAQYDEAKIILYSLDINAPRIAKSQHTEFLDKFGCTWLQIVQKFKEMHSS